ncbi:MAG: hypothetical protein GY822_05385 [Deltaproteobacteria bacterium]|nr:hypothetical protein [Deltaproteobacteria bacterium]
MRLIPSLILLTALVSGLFGCSRDLPFQLPDECKSEESIYEELAWDEENSQGVSGDDVLAMTIGTRDFEVEWFDGTTTVLHVETKRGSATPIYTERVGCSGWFDVPLDQNGFTDDGRIAPEEQLDRLGQPGLGFGRGFEPEVTTLGDLDIIEALRSAEGLLPTMEVFDPHTLLEIHAAGETWVGNIFVEASAREPTFEDGHLMEVCGEIATIRPLN